MTPANAGEDVQKLDHLHVGGNMYSGTAILKTIGRLFKKLNMQLPYDPAIALQSTCPRQMKTCAHKKKKLCECICSFIHHNPNLETIQISFSG